MGEASDRLMKLRPVTFRYKDDRSGSPQYGLVAEEVEPVYPELVTHGADGKVETVRYSMLTSMLLNELQKQTRENERQAGELRNMRKRLAVLEQAMQTSKGDRELPAFFNR
ncbi:MAG TPA: tail fiber domain-containing protein [Candidatus Binataceae bacterium]|nr:tail fiber domain-containing protein [Candidatus Binataceae bacterium]